jgi:ribosomal protein L11 methyltransferase
MPLVRAVIDVPERDSAHSIAGALQEIVQPAPDALTLFEAPGQGWHIEAYYAEQPEAEALAAALAGALGQAPPHVTLEPVPDRNWVAISQAALPPVAAGRFIVHGSHDRGRIPQGPGAILIEAGEAFGTAHHATTYGCLLAIDQLTRDSRRLPAAPRILDLGCGSGVLAIALARSLPKARVLASDMDARSVEVARDNAQANRAGRRIGFVRAAGLHHPALRRPRGFDLVVANILAGPLRALAPSLAAGVRPGATLILSGLLAHESRPVASTYRAHGFALERLAEVTGWAVLTLRRRP